MKPIQAHKAHLVNYYKANSVGLLKSSLGGIISELILEDYFEDLHLGVILELKPNGVPRFSRM